AASAESDYAIGACLTRRGGCLFDDVFGRVSLHVAADCDMDACQLQRVGCGLGQACLVQPIVSDKKGMANSQIACCFAQAGARAVMADNARGCLKVEWIHCLIPDDDAGKTGLKKKSSW